MKQSILDRLPSDHPWRDLLQVHERLDSTNTHARELARQGAPAGTVIIAQAQSAGRGRLGRSFHSPADTGLYFSLILRPDCKPEQLMHLTCAAAVAACDAVERSCGLRPGIKWINDLTLEGKKLGGILTELSFGGDGRVSSAVIGIGINVKKKSFPRELQPIACSLADFAPQPELSALAAELMLSLEEMSRSLLPDRAGLMDRYRKDCITTGRQVRIIGADSIRTGLAEAIQDDGSLQVLFDDGQRKTVNSGEVSVRGLWDYI
jgi:BirA family biotin operon repressor/biotin-[acetyl-CoA-carboxylase] ligase